MAKAASTVSFSFPKFVRGEKYLILQADAVVTLGGKLQLTKVEDGKPLYDSIGRALFAFPIQIWDSKTGNVASFKTSFSFIIDASHPSKTADGLAFFLAPVDTQPQTSGGLLGLFPNKDKDCNNHLVAVEFDTFNNLEWDPVNTHIGINVNGISSEKTTPWNLLNGEQANVDIHYEASTKILSATLSYPNSTENIIYHLSHTVDLKDVLPEFVRVGFSAASGLSADYNEAHDVLSWSFEAKLDDAPPNSA